MELSNEELVALNRAKIGLKWWPYARLLNLVAGFMSVVCAFWLITADLSEAQLNYAAPVVLMVLGVVLIIVSVGSWQDTERKLLLRLADSALGSGDT